MVTLLGEIIYINSPARLHVDATSVLHPRFAADDAAVVGTMVDLNRGICRP
jgi:hypothetical protein